MERKLTAYLATVALFAAILLCLAWGFPLMVIILFFSWTLFVALPFGSPIGFSFIFLIPLALIAFVNLYYWQRLRECYAKRRTVTSMIEIAHFGIGLALLFWGSPDLRYWKAKCIIELLLVAYAFHVLVVKCSWRKER